MLKSRPSRQERRAQVRKDPIGNVQFARPPEKHSQHKTLLDIAEERQLLKKSTSSSGIKIKTITAGADGTFSTGNAATSSTSSTSAAYLDIFLYTLTLSAVHFTFTVLVHHQYATEPPSLSQLFYASTILPLTPLILLTLVAILHPRSSLIPIQILFAAMSLVAGMWLVYTSNTEGYMAAMKKAPPLGTLWVWATVEMRWELALGCLGLVVTWAWVSGYGMF